MDNLNEVFRTFITDYMSKSENNTMKKLDLPAFAAPLVGFSSAADPLYDYYKSHIGEEFYRTPDEWLNKFSNSALSKDNISVISWVLPQTEEVKAKCRENKVCPALEWEYVRVYGEECNRALALAVQEFARSLGIPALAPMVSEEFAWFPSERFTLASNWSERHTAYISGLGTFGLCDGLITSVGKAIRIGSCIVGAKLVPTQRPYTRYDEYCLKDQGCTACINRCPAGAISRENGHNKPKCQEYHKNVISPYCHDEYGYDGYAVCGLCQTGVPCESGIPERKNIM